MTPSRCSSLTAPQHIRMMATVCKLLSFCSSLSILISSFLLLYPKALYLTLYHFIFNFIYKVTKLHWSYTEQTPSVFKSSLLHPAKSSALMCLSLSLSFHPSISPFPGASSSHVPTFSPSKQLFFSLPLLPLPLALQSITFTVLHSLGLAFTWRFHSNNNLQLHVCMLLCVFDSWFSFTHCQQKTKFTTKCLLKQNKPLCVLLKSLNMICFHISRWWKLFLK